MTARPQDLEPWLSEARSGSTDALGQALEACRRYLLYIAHQELDTALQVKGSHSDLVQETFLEAHRDFAQFRGTSADELRAWLRSLLIHRVAKLGRRFRHTRKRSLRREVPLNLVSQVDNSPGGLPSGDLTPSRVLMAGEQMETLLQAIGRLPADYQQVIQLRYQEGRSFENIANMMHRTPNAVRLLWFRAVERIRQELHGNET